MRDGLAVLHVDPCVQLVSEPDGVDGRQGLNVGQYVGRRLIVVGDALAERQAEHSLDRGGRDPRTGTWRWLRI
jgi:hypothetical protein